ncbi:hypothetical protein PIB30_034104, partial [Stylosanthes scabra]|nr:hypothetical protein [Stylosanthes scabra]
RVYVYKSMFLDIHLESPIELKFVRTIITKMASTKNLYALAWLVLLIFLLLLLLPNKCESRALPQVVVEKKKITSSRGSMEFMKKSQELRASLAKQRLIKFPNNYDPDRLSPGGPDPKHH